MSALYRWFLDLNPLLQALALVPYLGLYWIAPRLVQRFRRPAGAWLSLVPEDPACGVRNAIGLGGAFLFFRFFTGSSVGCLQLLALGVVTYLLGLAIARSEGRQRLILTSCSVAGVLGWLVVFKYAALLVNGLNAVLAGVRLGTLPTPEILAPLGVSYYTFRIISYLVEVHWEDAPRVSLLEYLHYLAFFPTAVAGPIERIAPFQEQGQGIRLRADHLEVGFHRIVTGIAKKAILADLVGGLAMNWPRAHPHTSAWYSLPLFYVYWLRLYWDFSGYSDIAIGAGRLMGYEIAENFDRPYVATNIQQFWQRWHMSLSFWIRDYLYTPLVAYRPARRWGRPWTFGALVISMGLCGIWHGSAPAFFWWGIYHGAGLVTCAIYQDLKRKYFAGQSWLASSITRWASAAATLTFVTAGLWLFFDTGWVLPKAWLATSLVRLLHGG